MANSNSFLSPYKISPMANHLGEFPYLIMKLYVEFTH